MTQSAFRKFWTVVYLLVLGWVAFNYFHHGGAKVIVCPFRLVTGLPCPGCGITRATVLCLHGCFREAVALNLNFILAVGFIICGPFLLAYDLMTGRIYSFYVRHAADKRFKQSMYVFLAVELVYWVARMIASYA